MNSSQQKSKLPGINSPGFDKSVLLATATDWTQKLYKTKPTYVARKVNNEELFGETLRPTTTLGLSQINEERGNYDVEDVDLLAGEDAYESEEPKNIFQSEALISSKYKEHGKGPAYDHGGQLVKHSIVGPIEIFERSQRGAKKLTQKEQKEMKESGASSEKETVSFSERSLSRTLRPLGSYHINDMSTSSLGRINTQSSILMKKPIIADKKKDVKNLKINKEDLYSKIDELRENQKNFYKQEVQKYKRLPIGDQLHHSKQERCLDKFDGTLNNWNEGMNNINKQIKRKVGRSVMVTSDDFRGKVEESEAFNLLQTEQERFGTTFWYMTLRKYGDNYDTGAQRMLRDIPEGFHTPQIVRPPTSVEIVKRPTQLSRNGTTGLTGTLLPSLSEAKLLDRTKNEYILDKSITCRTDFKKFMPNPNIDVNNLMVGGRNKLELEVTAFFKANPYKDNFTVPKQLFDKQSQGEEECLVSNYDNKEITKNGLAAFLR